MLFLPPSIGAENNADALALDTSIGRRGVDYRMQRAAGGEESVLAAFRSSPVGHLQSRIGAASCKVPK